MLTFKLLPLLEEEVHPSLHAQYSGRFMNGHSAVRVLYTGYRMESDQYQIVELNFGFAHSSLENPVTLPSTIHIEASFNSMVAFCLTSLWDQY